MLIFTEVNIYNIVDKIYNNIHINICILCNQYILFSYILPFTPDFVFCIVVIMISGKNVIYLKTRRSPF